MGALYDRLNESFYNNTSWFEGNTLIDVPEGKGEGRTEGAALGPSSPVPEGPAINVLPSKHEVLFLLYAFLMNLYT